MRLRCRNMEKDKSIFLINTITKENSLTTKDKGMELCFFSMTQSTKVSGHKDKNMERESIKTNHLVSTIKVNGKMAKEMA
jgi:hypothetical protein